MIIYRSQNIQFLFQMCKTHFISQYGMGKQALLKMLIKPIFVLSIFSLVFDRFIRVETGDVPYPVFAFIGLIIWETFFSSFVGSLNFLKQHAEILKNFSISFRLIQLSEMMNIFIEALVKIVVFNCICFYYGDFDVLRNLLLFSASMIFPIFLGYGMGIYFVVGDIKHKVIINNIPYFFGYLMWLTPVFFSETLVPENFRFVVYFNPVAEQIYFARHLILGYNLDFAYTGIPMLVFTLLSFGGFYLFERTRYKLIEII